MNIFQQIANKELGHKNGRHECNYMGCRNKPFQAVSMEGLNYSVWLCRKHYKEEYEVSE